ncbi:ketopantoate reductase PanE/ApbA C terminal-domain-containing protein [Aspergillus coremiiformis]|uniref:2-dehydropantoate 2-reductase n=1 Tax=Aspergillus coremiiformis TaxID=138285 RepID=A0A5N6YXW7_9EURO|nr:ketopantoate reductase PanE/ApbA C terminal-domain-containing protein [Aspergillus coremiiformis]
MHTPDIYRSWLERKKCLAINTNGLDDVKTGFDVNVLNDKTWLSIPYWNQDGTAENGNDTIDKYAQQAQIEESSAQLAEDERIECLIVAVKAPMTVRAIESVKHRLTPDSTVLFLQNGMGAIEEVNEKVYPDPRHRPRYICGLISHGLTRREKPFQVSHTGVGTTILGSIPPAGSVSPTKDGHEDWVPSTKYLLRTLTLTPPLVAFAETPSSLMLYQLEKLAMNCVINPLTAIMNCKNGELLYNYSFTRIMRLLLFEISSVICALPELQGVPGIESRFSPERLRMMVTQLANKTAKNHSSMLQDLLSRKTTEIEYMNGYIIRRGEELGIKCVVNYTIKHLVLAKHLQTKHLESGAIPIDLLRESKM